MDTYGESNNKIFLYSTIGNGNNNEIFRITWCFDSENENT